MSNFKPRCKSDPKVAVLADALKALADPTRLMILCLLRDGEACVCDVEGQLGISQQLTSHHLHVLKEAGILHMRKVGTMRFYSINREFLKTVNQAFNEYLDWRKVKEKKREGVVC